MIIFYGNWAMFALTGEKSSGTPKVFGVRFEIGFQGWRRSTKSIWHLLDGTGIIDFILA